MPKAKKLFRPEFWYVPTLVSDHQNTEPFDEKVYACIHWFQQMKDGECFASNKTIAEVIKPHNPQPRSVQNSLNRLEKSGFIARDYKDKAKRNRIRIRALISFRLERKADDRRKTNETTMTVERNGNDSGERNGHDQSNNILNKNIKEEKLSPKELSKDFFSKGESYLLFLDYLSDKGMPKSTAYGEVNKFISYWTELNSTGKKERWQMEKTFEVKRRLSTWFSKSKQFSGKKSKESRLLV